MSIRQPKQQRSLATRERIAQATIQLLGETGEAGLTHRNVAQRAEVSLAATTYHHARKYELLEHASSVILEDYAARFRRFASRLAAASAGRPSFDEFLVRLLRNAAGRDRPRTLAWCEIMLIATRSPQTSALAKVWYARLREIWTEISALLGAGTQPMQVQAAIDLTIGLLLLVVSLGLSPDEAQACWRDGLPLDTPAEAAPPADPAPARRGKGEETRQQLLDAAIRLMATQGAGAVTGRAVAAEAGVAPGVPSYYFKPIALLVDAAREQLYEAAAARYRQSAAGIDLEHAPLEQIVDISTATLIREVTQFSDFNRAILAIEVEAARQPALRPMVRRWFSERSRPWQRLLTRFNPAAGDAHGLFMTCLFTGMQLRLLATGTEIGALGDTRLEFLAQLETLVHATPASARK